MVISVVKSKANFSSVTDSEPFLSARLIFLMDCEREMMTAYKLPPEYGAIKCSFEQHQVRASLIAKSRTIQRAEGKFSFIKVFCMLLKEICTNHIPESRTCALAGRVVFQDGGAVNQISNILTEK